MINAERPRTVKLSNIKINDPFWTRYTGLVSQVILPYQWDILNERVEGTQVSDCLHSLNAVVEKAHISSCLKNFRIAAGLEQGTYMGVIFQDTDAYKWLEAVAYSLEVNPDAKLEALADETITLIEKAQQSDGYLNTYYTIAEPNSRWSNLIEGHELYTAGHLIEAAVAYYNATGKNVLLNVAKRFADLISKVFGHGEGKLHGYPGHQEIELALIKLYYVTGDKKYLDTAKYFIDERGSEPNYFAEEIRLRDGKWIFPEFSNYDLKYSQSHIQPKKQRAADGHAVRAMYMYCAMADLAYEYKDAELMSACEALWESVVNKRMYITGSTGSSGFLERFTADFDLPNDTNYSETCASIGLALFSMRMSSIKRDASYMDIAEKALYNTVLAGISLEGDSYFYVNPLEVWPESCLPNTSKAHVKPTRRRWFSVACCPPNIARTLASLGQYIYMQDENSLYLNLFIQNKSEISFSGHKIPFELKSSFISDGKSELSFEAKAKLDFSIKIRVPSYVESYSFSVNGKLCTPEIVNGYAVFSGSWEGKSVIGIDYDVPARFVAANPEVRADLGKVALMKGPLVYCLEEIDNGKNLSAVYVDPSTKPITCAVGNVPDGVPVLSYKGYRLENDGICGKLYGEPSFKLANTTLTAVPYAMWGNRGAGEMLVWQKALLRQ